MEISAMGLGGAPIGGRFGRLETAQVHSVLDAAFALDLNFIDTAGRYAEGGSESELGEYLARRPRSSYVISTKICPNPKTKPRRRGVLDAVVSSLERLRCDVLDIALIHDPYGSSDEELVELVTAMAELRSLGLVRAIGVGVDDVSILVRVVKSMEVDCVLVSGRYTLLDQTASFELLPLCLERGVGVILGSVFNSGILATGNTKGARFDYKHNIPVAITEQVHQFQSLCSEFAVDLQSAALQFSLAHPSVSSVLVGTTNPAHLIETRKAADSPIPPEFWAAVRGSGLVHSASFLPCER